MANAGHGGRGGTAALRQRNKAGNGETKSSGSISGSPECVEATSETGEAMVTRFDGDRDHGGANLVDDSVPATAMGKTSRQEWNKHYSIETKPQGQQSRTTAHQTRLATVNRRFR